MRTETFAQCKIFLQGTLLVTNFANCVNTLINETNVKVEATILNQL